MVVFYTINNLKLYYLIRFIVSNNALYIKMNALLFCILKYMYQTIKAPTGAFMQIFKPERTNSPQIRRGRLFDEHGHGIIERHHGLVLRPEAAD